MPSEAEVREVMELVLKPTGASGNIVRTETPSWDSLKHIELVFTLEDAFDTKFEPTEIENLDSLDTIVTTLQAKQ